MLTPFLMTSSLVMTITTIMAISSTNWLFLWAALELNLLSFIPILMNSKSSQETEAAVKYFLTQALGSSVMLMSSMSLWFYLNVPNQQMSLLIMLSLILKMGMAPCHMWYPSVMTSISWMAALILSTWQKLAPLIVMSTMFSNSLLSMMLFIATLNAIIGGLIGMNQSHMRTIMAYSSITHMGWMMSLIAMSKPIATLTYFIIYSIIICPMFIMLHIKKVNNSNNSNKLVNNSHMYQFIIPMLLLSLSGIPPLTGFIPKWMTISIMSISYPSVTSLLIAGAMMNTYFYLNIAFNFLLSTKSNQNSISSKTQFPMISISSLAFMMLISMPMFMMM